MALLRYLADHARLTVATTHYGESLRALKYQDERFENASVDLMWRVYRTPIGCCGAFRVGLMPWRLRGGWAYWKLW